MTHNTVRWALTGVAALGLLVLCGVAAADEEIAEAENMVCTSCHDKPGSKLLTDQGKYYELMGSMVGFTEVKATFEKCTACHVRKPGSAKLTRRGQQFSFAVGDMEGLLKWMKSEHPGWPDGMAAKTDKGLSKTPKEEDD